MLPEICRGKSSATLSDADSLAVQCCHSSSPQTGAMLVAVSREFSLTFHVTIQLWSSASARLDTSSAHLNE